MPLLSKQPSRSIVAHITKVGLELAYSIYVYTLNLGGLGKISYARVLMDDYPWQRMDI